LQSADVFNGLFEQVRAWGAASEDKLDDVADILSTTDAEVRHLYFFGFFTF
jgi:hypothetical protein